MKERVFHVFPNIGDQKIFLQRVSTCVFTHNAHTQQKRSVCMRVKTAEDFSRDGRRHT